MHSLDFWGAKVLTIDEFIRPPYDLAMATCDAFRRFQLHVRNKLIFGLTSPDFSCIHDITMVDGRFEVFGIKREIRTPVQRVRHNYVETTK